MLSKNENSSFPKNSIPQDGMTHKEIWVIQYLHINEQGARFWKKENNERLTQESIAKKVYEHKRKKYPYTIFRLVKETYIRELVATNYQALQETEENS